MREQALTIMAVLIAVLATYSTADEQSARNIAPSYEVRAYYRRSHGVDEMLLTHTAAPKNYPHELHREKSTVTNAFPVGSWRSHPLGTRSGDRSFFYRLAFEEMGIFRYEGIHSSYDVRARPRSLISCTTNHFTGTYSLSSATQIFFRINAGLIYGVPHKGME